VTLVTRFLLWDRPRTSKYAGFVRVTDECKENAMVSSVDTSVGTERKVITELPGPRSAPCTSAVTPS